MARDQQMFGQRSEAVAAAHLRRLGFRILERNARWRSGELDLIAERAGTLVFVEVKARRTVAYGGTAYAVDARKQARLIRLAAHYLARHGIQDRPCRFDVVLVNETGGAVPALEHIENAFEVSGDDLRW